MKFLVVVFVMVACCNFGFSAERQSIQSNAADSLQARATAPKGSENPPADSLSSAKHENPSSPALPPDSGNREFDSLTSKQILDSSYISPPRVDTVSIISDSLASKNINDSSKTTVVADTVLSTKSIYSILGQIRDGTTLAPLRGVNICMISRPSLTTRSDSSGDFLLVCDSAGDYTLRLSIRGYAADSFSVNVSEANTYCPMITLWKPSGNMGTIVVTGKSGGQAKALTRQKNADNLKNVISSELIEKLPDQSAADALQRVPGVSLQREQGEGRYIQIRGTESRLSTVTINGQSIGSPDGKTRATALNIIPSDQLAEIEVSKVLMPEMDGDAIGGTVNLVTSTAKDSNLAVKANLTPGYSALSNTPLWQGSASIGKRFLKDNALGFIMGGSYNRTEKETDAVTMHWDTTVYKRLVLDTSIKPLDYLTNLQLRQSDKTNERIGGTAKLDFRFSPVSNAFFSASYNRFAAQEYRRSLAFSIIGNDSRPEASNFYVVRDVPVTHGLRDRYREQDITSFTLGGATKISKMKLDGSATYSGATNNEPDRIDIAFGSKFGIKYSVDDPDNPEYFPFNVAVYNGSKFTGIPVFKYDSAFDNPAKATSNGITIENKNANEKTVAGVFNAMVPFDLFSGTLEIKTGVKGTDHQKDQTVKYTNYIAAADSTTRQQNLSTFLDDYSNRNFYNGRYTLNMMPDPAKVRSYYIPPPSYLRPDTALKANSPDAETYTANDRNGAGYLQGKLKTGPWLLICGVRLEYTSMRYTGYTDSLKNNVYILTHPVSMYRNFLFALPMILGRYSLTKDLNLRASYTRSFSRPDWYDLVPHSIESFDDATGTRTIDKGNPDLRPTRSNNADLSGEFYNGTKGLISAGVFYKRMSDYIFSTSNDEQPVGSKEMVTTYQKGNGGIANLAGTEINAQQQFTFLPWFFDGFGINGNYTYTWSATRVPGFSRDSPLPGQSVHVANGAVFYEKFGFSGRIAVNFQSNFITEIATFSNNMSGEVLFQNTCVDDHTQLDCSLSQKLGKHFTFLVELSNLTNEPYKIYLGDPRHPVQKEYYSWSGQSGVRMSF